MQSENQKKLSSALEGVKVVECATIIAAPLCGRFMADFGADVIHVENPKTGDHLRKFGFTVDGINPWWKCYARNKKLVSLDISKPKGREILFRLLADADVFIENFRPGRLEEWGIHYEDLSKINPGLIMVRVTGYGQSGPYRTQPGFGTLMEAMSGFAEMTGEPDGPPMLPQFALADTFAGMNATIATMFALYYRDALGAGKGQVIDVSIWESLYSALGPNALVYSLTGKAPRRMGNRAPTSSPRNTYRTKDGRWVAIAGATQTTASRLFGVIGQPDLIRDRRFDCNENRIVNADALDEIIAAWMAEHTREEVTRILRESEVPFGPVYDIFDIMQDPHARARNMVIEVPDEGGTALPMEGIFPIMQKTPGRLRHAGKRLGADNKQVFESIALTAKDIAKLSEDGVI